ncbi:MAG TPA: FHA domain-containing protein, partial [Candidatus Limnocylindria bacterium]
MNDRREWLLVRADGVGEARIAIGSQPVRIGRGPENQIVLPDTYASARHAEVVEHEGQRWLRDLGSTNGTRLNGRVLAPGTLHALGDGDLIQIG